MDEIEIYGRSTYEYGKYHNYDAGGWGSTTYQVLMVRTVISICMEESTSFMSGRSQQ